MVAEAVTTVIMVTVAVETAGKEPSPSVGWKRLRVTGASFFDLEASFRVLDT